VKSPSSRFRQTLRPDFASRQLTMPLSLTQYSSLPTRGGEGLSGADSSQATADC
jgi:hypothetical protein